jgi:hypothetical protein
MLFALDTQLRSRDTDLRPAFIRIEYVGVIALYSPHFLVELGQQLDRAERRIVPH